MSTTPISWVVVAVPVAAADPVEPVPEPPLNAPAPPWSPKPPYPPRQPVAAGCSAGEACPTTVVVPPPAACTPTTAPAAIPRTPNALSAPTTARRRCGGRGATTCCCAGYPGTANPESPVVCCACISSTFPSEGPQP